MAVVGDSTGDLRRQARRDLRSAEQRQNADCRDGQPKTGAHGILHSARPDEKYGTDYATVCKILRKKGMPVNLQSTTVNNWFSAGYGREAA